MKNFRAFLLAVACLLPTMGLAATVTLNPTADAYVQNGTNATKNYGTATQLRAQTSSTAASNYDSYLRFDSTNASGTITSAKLRLYTSLSKAGSVSSSIHGVADTGWGETTITWNNKPALGAVLGSLSTTSTSYAWKEIDVTAYVQSEKAAGRHVISLGLHNAATSSVYVLADSRNATSNKPELVIVTTSTNVAPTASMTGPADGSSYAAPASITLAATAADSDGSIANVAFYNGATLIGTGTLSGGSYMLIWSNIPAGSYSLTARATDNQGASADSAPVAVTVTDPPPPPVAAGVYYVYADHLNTPRVITDTSNKVVWRWDSDPFGADAANEDPDGDGTKFRYNPRFPGQYFDKETGLHYNYFRDYDSSTGRYIEADPIGLAGGSNLYLYANAAPTMYTDPLGLKPWDWNGQGNVSKCSYYDNMAKKFPKCDYYKQAGKICRGQDGLVNRVVNTGLRSAWLLGGQDSQATVLSNIRDILIQEDITARNANLTDKSGCTCGNTIDAYHNFAFDFSGLPAWSYGGNLWPQSISPNPVPADPRNGNLSPGNWLK